MISSTSEKRIPAMKGQLMAYLLPQLWHSSSSFECPAPLFAACCTLSKSCLVELAISHLRCPSRVRISRRPSWPLAVGPSWFGSPPEARKLLRTSSRRVPDPSLRVLSFPWHLCACCDTFSRHVLAPLPLHPRPCPIGTTYRRGMRPCVGYFQEGSSSSAGPGIFLG